MSVFILGGLIGTAVLGVAAGYGYRSLMAGKQVGSAEAKAKALITEAELKHKQKILDAEEKSIKILNDAKKEYEERRQEVKAQQDRVEKKETTLENRLAEMEKKQERVENELKELDADKEEIKKIKTEQLAKLEKVAGLDQDKAEEVLFKYVQKQRSEALMSRIKKIEEQETEQLEARGRQLLSNIIERCASNHSVETTTTNIALPNDEMKGRIIGKEGRNIKTLEQLTGVEILVDDTPETITISGFSPIRRQVAKKALASLMTDGRIHPGRIEEAVQKAKEELAIDMKKAGEEACYELGVTGLQPKLVQILGRLKYRTSYGQNQLQHALEVAHLSVMIAEELGADVKTCRVGGLLHDIGKAVDHDMQGGHPEIGYTIMKKFELPEEVAYLSIAHHEDHPKTIEGSIVKAADAISGARPGARKDTFQNYVQRLTELEDLAKGFEGVEKVYAIQAGREVRVFVRPEAINDLEAHNLAREVANKIESELKYPGEIRVTVIRETRVIDFAR